MDMDVRKMFPPLPTSRGGVATTYGDSEARQLCDHPPPTPPHPPPPVVSAREWESLV